MTQVPAHRSDFRHVRAIQGERAPTSGAPTSERWFADDLMAYDLAKAALATNDSASGVTPKT